jgi:sulfite exporter TauE/SafE
MYYFLEHCTNLINQQGSIFFSLFLGGLLGSLNHCVGMCSPFVLAQISCNEQPKFLLQKIYGASLIPYHTGRITTYILLAVITSAFSLHIIASPVGQFIIALLLGTAGLLFIINAIPTFFTKLQSFSVFNITSVISVLMRPLSHNNDFLSRYFFGIILGFLPCGLVFAALMLTSTMHNLGLAALGMLLFGLGTVPALFCVALFGQTMFKKWQNALRRISQVIMVLNGIMLIVMAIDKMMILM